MFPDGELVDLLGKNPPTRANLAPYYGSEFVDLIFDEALPSYPSDHRHVELGVPEHEVMSVLYPWFFPRARRERLDVNQSRAYQDRIRAEAKEYLLYPDEGGFGTFAEGFRARIEAMGVDVLTDVADLAFDVDLERRHVRSVTAHGRRLAAPRLYWCAPPGPLMSLLEMDVPDLKPDRFMLGSFQLARPITCDYNELIFGDPSHRINRISFPGKLALGDDDLVQIEFAFPEASGAYSHDTAFWCQTWRESLERLGIASKDNETVDVDVKSFRIMYNCYGVEGKPVPDLDVGEIPAGSNLRPVLPTVRNVNINTRVPQYLKFLAEDLGRNV
jgi:hypothetical protein